MIKLTTIKSNPDNPRLIKDEKFHKLCESLKSFGEKMMPLRPIVIDENNIILGGNMRFKALKEIGYKEVPDDWIKRADDLTDDQKREFIIKDNVGFGEWDWDLLGNDYDFEQLEEWGLDTIKHDWEDLDYIDEEVENKNFEEDNKIVVVLGEKHISNKRQVKDDLASWLEENYKGSEIK